MSWLGFWHGEGGIGFNLPFILETGEVIKGHSGWELLQPWCACHLCCRMTESQQPGGPCRGSPHALPLLLCLFGPFPEPYPFLTRSHPITVSIFVGFIAWTAWDSPSHGSDVFTRQLHRTERGKQSLGMEQVANAILLAGTLGKGSSQQKTTEIKCPKVTQVFYFITVLFNF